VKRTKVGIYLIQFIATAMIIGGGIAIAGEMVVGEHNIVGWVTVLFGALFLTVGAYSSRRHKNSVKN